MAQSKFEAKARAVADRVVLDLEGDIDAFAEEVLNEAYQQASGQDPDSIVLNFEEVDYINSTGIALIVSLLAQARKSHQELMVYGLSDHYKELFKITRLVDFMTIFEDEEAAFAA